MPSTELFSAQIFAEAVRRHQGQETAAAETLYRAILTLSPQHADASYNLGILLQARGNFADAALAYRNAITLRPDFAGAYSNLGTALQELGRLDEAIAIYRDAIALQPDFAMAHLNIGAALREQGKFAEAAVACRRALAIQPDYDQAYVNLSAALLDLDEPEAAIEASRQAIAVNPGMVFGYCNLGAACKALNRLGEAEEAYRQAIAASPDFPEAHFCLAQILLLQGRYDAGWAEYEWRWKLKEYGWLETLYGSFAQAAWGGKTLAGKTILVYAEQGFGNAIQFVRYLPLLRRHGAAVILAAHSPFDTAPARAGWHHRGSARPAATAALRRSLRAAEPPGAVWHDARHHSRRNALSCRRSNRSVPLARPHRRLQIAESEWSGLAIPRSVETGCDHPALPPWRRFSRCRMFNLSGSSSDRGGKT